MLKCEDGHIVCIDKRSIYDLIGFHSNERGPLRRVPHWWSLSGMGLTRGRWCCAGDWLSRVDVNTCQTSTKTSILLIYLGNLHPEYQRNETPQWFLAN